LRSLGKRPWEIVDWSRKRGLETFTRQTRSMPSYGVHPENSSPPMQHD